MRKTREMENGFSTGDYQQQNTFYNPNSAQSYPVQNMQYMQNTQSANYGAPQAPNNFPDLSVLQNPAVANMAMHYGSSAVSEGSSYVQKTMGRYVSVANLRYYFDVDNFYVAKKLLLILFPYAHTKWSLQYDHSGPIPPRNDINAFDLYIPVMALITYVLVSGTVLGTQERFTPEQLGITASQALGWLTFEIGLLSLTLYLLSVRTTLAFLDLIALTSYKFVSMIAILMAFLVFSSFGYYVALVWTSAALAFFLLRSLKLHVLPHSESSYANTAEQISGYNLDGTPMMLPTASVGTRRGLYLLLIIALIQPFIIWWLTSGVALSGVKKLVANDL